MMSNGRRGRRRIAATWAALLSVVLISSCASGPQEGMLEIVVADQTVENPRDVIEIIVGDDLPIYPDSARGGSPTEAGTWTAGDDITVTIWPTGTEEQPVLLTIDVPSDLESDRLSLVIEIEDDSVVSRATAIGFDSLAERTNPVQEQRKAEAKAAEDEAKAAEEAEAEAERELQALVLSIRSEATRLDGEMRHMQGKLNEILDEHNTVYGDDDWATFNQIAKKYRAYTTEALDDLQSDLPNSTFESEQVTAANRRWQTWWTGFIRVHSRQEAAARNNNSTAMDAAREDENELWDEWSSIFESVDELAAITADDI